METKMNNQKDAAASDSKRLVRLTELHDLYLEEANIHVDNWKQWCKVKGAGGGKMSANARLEQGKATALFNVVNDIREIQGKDPLHDNWSEGFGYLNQE